MNHFSAILWVSAMAVATASGAPPHTLHLKWEALDPLIIDQPISFTTKSGVSIDGVARSVRADALLVQVHKSSNPALVSKGSATIPRTELTELTVTRYPSRRWRKTGVGIGVVGGLLTGVVAAIAAGGDDSAAPGDKTRNTIRGAAAFFACFGGGIAGGYLIGRQADREVTQVVIIP